MQWHDRSVVAGSWRIRAELKIMTLNGQWRIAIVQIFCTWFSDMDAVAQQDNCRELGGFDSVFTQGRGTNREYRKGNIFSLRVDEQSVEQLSKTEITIESVLAMKGRRAD
jgi:hypothetical protein